MTRCMDCGESIAANNIRWAFEQPYCERCHSNLFTYCCNCDIEIYRNDAFYNSDGEPYCEGCYEGDEDETDHDCPDNPEVYEEDRKDIIHLSRQWLEGKLETKKHISINKKDYFLNNIRAIVGLVEKPIYLFGLIDRDEYQISASQNIIDKVKEHFQNIIITETGGVNRLGFSLTLRKTNQQQIADLIKSLTN